MIYLCKPGGVILSILDNVDESSASLTYTISDCWEFSFEISRYDSNLKQTELYESINEMMELLLVTDNEKIRFQINSEPQISGDGVKETKNITAKSIECELGDKFLRAFKINCGTTDSQEYLCGYYDEDDNFINVNLNPYTNLPIDYIVVQNDFATRLAAEKEIIQGLNLNIDAESGLVQNLDTYDYLYGLYTTYPRLSCDIQGGGDCKVYLNVETADNEYGFNIYIVNTDGVYTKEYFLSAIDSLIAFYQQYGSQLSLIDLALENAKAAGWSVGDIPEDVRVKKYNFSIDNQDLLSFFRQECSQTMKVILDFDRFDRKVNIIDIVNEGNEHDTGVFLTYRNLLKSVDISSSSSEGIRTKYIPTGNNNLGILYANFGEDSIINLDWLMDKINEYDENQYVSKELHDKYHRWRAFRESEPVSYALNDKTYSYDSRRDAYRELSRIYNQCMIDIDAFMYRVPNDGCNVDYTTFTFKELNIAYKAYMNALDTLEQLYMGDYGAVEFNRETQVAINAKGEECTPIRETMYWWDFDCYYYTIIPNVLNALRMYVLTDETGELSTLNPRQYDEEKGEWIENEGGNPWYNGDAKRVTENMSDSFKYDMSLYGTVELAAKKKAWQEAAGVLYKPGYVLQNGAVADPIPLDDYTYNTADEAGWNRLSAEQKEGFTSKDSFIKSLNEYYDYVTTYERENALTKRVSKGVIQMAQDAIDELQPELDRMTEEQNIINEQRKIIADEALLENWSEFTEEDKILIYTLIRQSDYNNGNILITNLDDIATTVDAQEELYQDAVIALSERARPQLSFEIDLDNLFEIEEFKAFRDSVKLLNFIRVSIGLYHDEFVKLRIVSIEKNPLVPTDDLRLSFSNMTYSIQDANDFAHFFGDGKGGSSGGGGGGGSSSGGGTYGNNDAEITIANNMLNALLKSKTYQSVVGQKLATNLSGEVATQIVLAYSGTFEKFETGDIKVSGDCITDRLKSSNYVPTTSDPLSNTTGSYIGMKEGYFNLGGGGIVWDGSHLRLRADSVSIEGQDVATSIDNASKVATNYLYYDNANGLVISENSEVSSGYNTRIYNSAIDMRNGSKVLSRISDQGLMIYDGNGTNENNTLATFGANAIIGKTSSYHTYITSAGIQLKNNNQILAQFLGSSLRLGDSSSGQYLVIDNDSIDIYDGNESVMNFDGQGNITITGDLNVDGVYKIQGEDAVTQESMNTAINTSLNLAFASNFYIQEVYIGKSVKIGAGKTKGYTVPVSQVGYAPIGIIGYRVFNPSGGKYCSQITMYQLRYNEATSAINCTVKNRASKTAKVNITAYMLFAKNTVPVSIVDDGAYSGDGGSDIIDASVVSISVTTMPTKLTYNSGEALDLIGLTVSALYDEGSTLIVTGTCQYSPANGTILTNDSSVPIPQTVTISFTDDEDTVTTSFDVTVNP